MSAPKIVTRYGLSTGQFIEVEEKGYDNPAEVMDTINFAMNHGKFVDYPTVKILRESIISVEIIEK